MMTMFSVYRDGKWNKILFNYLIEMQDYPYPPRKIVYYPIPGDEKGGVLILYGSEEANKVVFCCPGWPDDYEILIPLASRLANEIDALVGVTCLPGFDDRADKPWIEHKREKRDGYTFDEMAGCLREASKALLSESRCSKPKIIGLFHDWGVLSGTMWANRAIEEKSLFKPDELIFMDVLLPPPSQIKVPGAKKKTIYQELCEGLYKILLGFSFWTQRYVANLGGILVFWVGWIPLYLFRLGPCRPIDLGVFYRSRDQPLGPSRLVYMSYPYANILKRFGRSIIFGDTLIEPDMRLPINFSNLPVLYLYGTEKRATFHDNRSLRLLEIEGEKRQGKSNAIAVNEAGHWLFAQKDDECFEHISKFIQT